MTRVGALVCAVAAVTAVTAVTTAVHADILWDQSALDTSPTGVGLVNTVTPGFNGAIVFGVNDVTVPAGGWTINSVSVYFSSFSFSPGTSAVLNVFPKTGSLPLAADDPRASPTGLGTLVSVSATDFVVDFQGIREYTASGLSVVLAPGDYWIGLTPVQSGGPFGADTQWSTSNPIGVGTAARDRTLGDSGWFNYGSAAGAPVNLDGAMKIQGVPAPSALALLGIGGAAMLRRRRS